MTAKPILVSEREWEILWLRGTLRLPHKQAAHVMGETIGATGMRLTRLRRRLGVRSNAELLAMFRRGEFAMVRRSAIDIANPTLARGDVTPTPHVPVSDASARRVAGGDAPQNRQQSLACTPTAAGATELRIDLLRQAAAADHPIAASHSESRAKAHVDGRRCLPGDECAPALTKPECVSRAPASRPAGGERHSLSGVTAGETAAISERP